MLCSIPRLVGVQEQKGHHQREQTRGFCKGETEDGVREELACQTKRLSLVRVQDNASQ